MLLLITVWLQQEDKIMTSYFTSHNERIRITPPQVEDKAADILARNRDEIDARNRVGSARKSVNEKYLQGLREKAAKEHQNRLDNKETARKFSEFWQNATLAHYRQKADNLRDKALNPEVSEFSKVIAALAPTASQAMMEQFKRKAAAEKQLGEQQSIQRGITYKQLQEYNTVSKYARQQGLDIQAVIADQEYKGTLTAENADYLHRASSFEKIGIRKGAVTTSIQGLRAWLASQSRVERPVAGGQMMSLEGAVDQNETKHVDQLVSELTLEYIKSNLSDVNIGYIQSVAGEEISNVQNAWRKSHDDAKQLRLAKQREASAAKSFQGNLEANGNDAINVAQTFHSDIFEKSKGNLKTYRNNTLIAAGQLEKALRTGTLRDAKKRLDAILEHKTPKGHPAGEGKEWQSLNPDLRDKLLQAYLDGEKEKNKGLILKQAELDQKNDMDLIKVKISLQNPENVTQKNLQSHLEAFHKAGNTKGVKYITNLFPLTPSAKKDAKGMELVEEGIMLGNPVSQEWINTYGFTPSWFKKASEFNINFKQSGPPDDVLKTAKGSIEGTLRGILKNKTTVDVAPGEFKQAVDRALQLYTQKYRSAYTATQDRGKANEHAWGDINKMLQDPEGLFKLSKPEKGKRQTFENFRGDSKTPIPYGEKVDSILKDNPNAIKTELLVDGKYMENISKTRRSGVMANVGPQINYLSLKVRNEKGRFLTPIEAWNFQAKLAIEAGYDVDLIGEEYVKPAAKAQDLVEETDVNISRLTHYSSIGNTAVILEGLGVPRETIYPELFPLNDKTGDGYGDSIWRQKRNLTAFADNILNNVMNTSSQRFNKEAVTA